jgi:hypothetical protein
LDKIKEKFKKGNKLTKSESLVKEEEDFYDDERERDVKSQDQKL